MTTQSEYDRVAYPSYTHPQTHPDRLAVLGRLFGLKPAAVTACRVLEVGCGDGTNLAPMAWALPGSEFVGLDLASQPVQRGQDMARELGLKNLRLVQANVTQLSPDWGRFDYILAHGFFSWVPHEAQQHLFEACRHLLQPQGIAFISYNAFPGCHLRQMVREMMHFHVRGFEEPRERIAQAQALLQFLVKAQDTRDEYRLWLKAELEQVQDHAPGHMYHDELAPLNEPLYFTQFMALAAEHHLQYLGEADFFEMSDHIFHEEVRERLKALGPNRLAREQYLDFLKCRRFRQTLLCRRDATLRAEPASAEVAGLLISSAAVRMPGHTDLRPGVRCVFENPKGAKCQTDLPMGKAALEILGSQWPFPLAFTDLVREIQQRLAQAGLTLDSAPVSREELCEFLLELYAGGVVEFRTWLPAIAPEPGLRPMVHPLARWQAQHGTWVASLFHLAVKVEDELGRMLLCRLDGTLEGPALKQAVWEFLRAKNALALGAGGEAEARRAMEAQLEQNLGKLARLGLLIPCP
ncbi:MAG TPA: class I SAM-dependent methyltransferase [Verrucomicrobiae bacterium]|nr:class I SAM-dependent methyltransferase [Verrucomicrobiae bacterium]